MQLLLIRHWFSPVSTCGLLEIEAVFFCYTLERQKFQPGMQKPYSVPCGTYQLELAPSMRFESLKPKWYDGEVPHLLDVPDFAGDEIHPGNWPSDLRGCIAVGSDHYENLVDPQTGIRAGAVLGSDATFAALMRQLRANQGPHSLTIQEEPQSA